METETTSPTPVSPSPETAPQPLRLTERAVARVKEIMTSEKLEGHVLSVRVVPAGCSGLGYDLNLVREPKANDVVWEQDGIRITTDPLSKKYLSGTEVDFVTGLQASGFKFNNPNAKQSCGCGTSFST